MGQPLTSWLLMESNFLYLCDIFSLRTHVLCKDGRRYPNRDRYNLLKEIVEERYFKEMIQLLVMVFLLKRHYKNSKQKLHNLKVL